MLKATEIEGYLIDNLGNIFSTKSNKYLTKQIKRGYICVNLSINGKTVTKSIHRLLAKAFIPNPNNYPCVNHIDENKLNNSVTNLEWCSISYNNAYNGRIQKIAQKHYKPVEVYKEDKLIMIYPSVKDTAKALSLDSRAISAVCRGDRNMHKGWIFRYKGGDANVKP